MSKAKTGCVAVLIVAVPAIAVGGFGYLAWKSGKVPTSLSMSTSTSTCREFAELLQSKGMDIRWVRCNAGNPSIYIVRSKDCKHNVDLMGAAGGGGLADANGEISDRNLEIALNEGYNWSRPKAVVRQHPSSQEASEIAGTTQSDFAWGRFVISGSPELVQEIKSKLR